MDYFELKTFESHQMQEKQDPSYRLVKEIYIYKGNFYLSGSILVLYQEQVDLNSSYPEEGANLNLCNKLC